MSPNGPRKNPNMLLVIKLISLMKKKLAMCIYFQALHHEYFNWAPPSGHHCHHQSIQLTGIRMVFGWPRIHQRLYCNKKLLVSARICCEYFFMIFFRLHQFLPQKQRKKDWVWGGRVYVLVLLSISEQNKLIKYDYWFNI